MVSLNCAYIALYFGRKNTHHLFWGVSVAGHVETGEEIKRAALREIEEEISLLISKENLEEIGVFKSIQKHRHDLINCEFHHTFLCELKVPLASLRKQESEVEALNLILLL